MYCKDIASTSDKHLQVHSLILSSHSTTIAYQKNLYYMFENRILSIATLIIYLLTN